MDAYDVLRHAAESEEPAALATVIGVEGHAYRKDGAMMLLLGGGGRVGSISPGCLESDLAERVPDLLASGENEIVFYNMKPEEDIVWGETVGCGGKLRILLEPVAGRLRAALREAFRRIEAGEAVRLVRRREGSALGYAVEAADFEAALPAAGVGVAGGAAIAEAVSAASGDGGASAVGDAMTGSDMAEPFYAVRLEPRPRLVLFGAGQDADPIFAAAGRIGFRLAVADWRAGLLSAERFPGAELASGAAQDIAARLGLNAADYVIVCGHQLRKDREMLETLLPIRPAYVGVMGSSSRIRLLFEGLPQLPFVHAPVGLRIGAEGAEEIAVSVAAELIAERRRLRALRGANGDGREDRGNLFGGWTEPQNGEAEAAPRACAR